MNTNKIYLWVYVARPNINYTIIQFYLQSKALGTLRKRRKKRNKNGKEKEGLIHAIL